MHPLSFSRPAVARAVCVAFVTYAIGLRVVPTPLAAALSPAAPPFSMTYRLDDTLGSVPWTLTAGRYASALDVSSADDGTTYVLDGDQAAVHVLAADGRPLAVWRLPEPAADRTPVALDVGADGRVYVLTLCEGCFEASAVDRLTGDGVIESRFAFGERYEDVAVRADGRLYLVRPDESRNGPEPLPAVDVFDLAGNWLEAVRDDAMAVPIRADIAADGNLYVLHTVPRPPTPGGGRGGRGPLPPPGPSAAGPDAQAPADPVSGVLRFDPSHRYLGTVPFAGGIDVAVRDGQAYVSAYGRVHAVGEDAPLSPVVGQRWSGRPALDVAPDGALVAALSHCSFQGVLRYDTPTDRPLAVHSVDGALDRPLLEGPAFALRVHARDTAVVLQAPFAAYGAWPGETYYDALPDDIPFTQSVQHWSVEGELDGQLGHCGQPRAISHARDVARDGDDVWVIDAECLTYRPDDAFVAWSFCPQGLLDPDVATQLAAVSADDGHAAVLDLGAGAVMVLDRAGNREAVWRLDESGPAFLPSDLALRDGRVWLAGLGTPRVQARALDGTPLADWPALDGAVAIDVGPDGDVYTLGRAGWGARYAPDGTPRALWPLPRTDVQAGDLSVADDGRVWVPWARRVTDASGRSARITQSGIWRFVAEDTPPPAGAPGGCALRRDKRAAPGRLPLGDAVTVALSIDGSCPGSTVPGRLAIVFDTSRSMTWDYVLERAKEAVVDLLGALPDQGVEVVLVTFDDAPVLAAPATTDKIDIARRVAALRGRGDTRMGAGLDLALRNLAEGNAPERRTLLIVSDGVPYDQTVDALERARADGVEVVAWLWENGQDRPDPAFIQSVIARGGMVHDPPGQADAATIASSLRDSIPQDGLLASGVVIDEVPANMRYLEGSAQPPATWDAASRVLTWALPSASAADGVRLTYRVVPMEVGRYPTNVRAEAEVIDARGTSGHVVFPVPEVEVYVPERIFLPLALRQACAQRQRAADVVLVIDTSSSMSESAAGGGTKLAAALAAAGSFVDQLVLPSDRVAVVTFDAEARVVAPLTGDRSAIAAALATVQSAQGTRIDLGLVEGQRVLAARAAVDRQAALVLLSDGLHGGEVADVIDAAEALRGLGALVYGIGLGDDTDLALLARVATTPDRAFHSPTAEDLAGIYVAIRERLECDGT